MVLLRFELKALQLLGRLSTTSDTPQPQPFLFSVCTSKMLMHGVLVSVVFAGFYCSPSLWMLLKFVLYLWFSAVWLQMLFSLNRSFLEFFELNFTCLVIFHQFWKILSHHFFKYVFFPVLSLTRAMYVLDHLIFFIYLRCFVLFYCFPSLSCLFFQFERFLLTCFQIHRFFPKWNSVCC
jgi:hypothetical protein